MYNDIKEERYKMEHAKIDCIIGSFITAQDFCKATIIISTLGNLLVIKLLNMSVGNFQHQLK